MTDNEVTKIEKVKAYLDEQGLSYRTHTENAVKKYAKPNITICVYNIYIRLSDENDILFRRYYKGKRFIILYPEQSPGNCLWRVVHTIKDVEKAHEEEKAHRAISFISSSNL